MKVVFVGVGHWHYPIYRAPLKDVSGIRLVGVMDPDPAIATSRAAAEGCLAETNLAALIDRTEPDLAFVMGRHADMPGYARTLIAAGVPFVLEKPGGLDAAEIRELDRAARTARLYVSVPLVFRTTGFMEAARELLSTEAPLLASFRFMAGLPQRYLQTGCGWMLEQHLAGGGVLTNLGIHFLDLIGEILPGGAPEVTSAQFARFAGLGDVEDFATITLRAGNAIGRVETGYLYPAPTSTFDMHFVLRTDAHYLTCHGPDSIEITGVDGRQSQRWASTTNVEVYPAYVRGVVEQVRSGRSPIAGLSDLAGLLDLIGQAYETGRT